MIKQKPLHNFLIVKRIEPPKETKSGVALPGTQEKAKEINFCEVLRVSANIKEIKAGNQLQAKEYSLAPVYGEKDWFVVDLEDVLYILEK